MTPRARTPAVTRRRALRVLAIGTSTLALGACTSVGAHDDDDDDDDDDTTTTGTGVATTDGAQTTGEGNGEPEWTEVPTLTFAFGVASSISIAEFVGDPDGDMLEILKNEVALPEGVTYDADTQRFVYDGIGPIGMTDGHVLTADDATT